MQEANTRQAVSLAEALSKAAYKLNISKPFDAGSWKASLQALQSALAKSYLVEPTGE